MALTSGKQNRNYAGSGLEDFAPQKGNTVVIAGGIVMIDTSGRALAGASGTGNIGVGVAETNRGIDRYDATSTGPKGQLADGAQYVRYNEGIFCFKNSGTQPFLSSDQPGLIAYIEDDETISKLVTGLSPAGFFHHLDADGVWVEMGKVKGALALDMITVTDAAAAHLAGAETFTGIKTFASGADPTFAKEAAHTVKVADTTTAATAGGALTMAAGKSGTSGTGGAYALKGGAGDTTGAGGAASLTGGAGGSASGTGGAASLVGGAGTAGNADGGAVSIQGGAKNGSGADGAIAIGTSAGAVTIGKSTNIETHNGPQASAATANTIAAAASAAIPVTASGVVAITTAGAETNTLAIPTFMGQWLVLVLDTDTSGARTITSAQNLNKGGDKTITLTSARDFVYLVAVTVGGALRWQVVSDPSSVVSA
jgi:hypothetical protein